jgi:hypothetical protein
MARRDNRIASGRARVFAGQQGVILAASAAKSIFSAAFMLKMGGAQTEAGNPPRQRRR